MSSSTVFSGQRLLYPKPKNSPFTPGNQPPVCSMLNCVGSAGGTSEPTCKSPTSSSKNGRIVEKITRGGDRVQVVQSSTCICMFLALSRADWFGFVIFLCHPSTIAFLHKALSWLCLKVWQAAPPIDETRWKPDPGRSPIYRVPSIDLV